MRGTQNRGKQWRKIEGGPRETTFKIGVRQMGRKQMGGKEMGQHSRWGKDKRVASVPRPSPSKLPMLTPPLPTHERQLRDGEIEISNRIGGWGQNCTSTTIISNAKPNPMEVTQFEDNINELRQGWQFLMFQLYSPISRTPTLHKSSFNILFHLYMDPVVVIVVLQVQHLPCFFAHSPILAFPTSCILLQRPCLALARWRPYFML